MTPATPPKVGRPHDPIKRTRILEALSGDPDEFFEVGPPPYSVADVAQRIGMDPSNLRKALLQLEAQGLVVRDWHKVSVWNPIAHDHVDRRCLCFWNAATLEKDRAEAKRWRDGAVERSERAFRETLDRFAATPGRLHSIGR